MEWKGTTSLCHLQLETMFHGDYSDSKQTLTTKLKIYILVLFCWQNVDIFSQKACQNNTDKASQNM